MSWRVSSFAQAPIRPRQCRVLADGHMLTTLCRARECAPEELAQAQRRLPPAATFLRVAPPTRQSRIRLCHAWMHACVYIPRKRRARWGGGSNLGEIGNIFKQEACRLFRMKQSRYFKKKHAAQICKSPHITSLAPRLARKPAGQEVERGNVVR